MADPMINVDKFHKWHADKDTEYFLSFINLKTQKLNKESVCKSAGIGYSALKPKKGNPRLIKAFNNFEATIIKKIKDKGLIASAVAKMPTQNSTLGNQAIAFDQDARINKQNADRVAFLEKSVLDLTNEIKQLKMQLMGAEQVAARHRETIEVITEVNGIL